MRNKDLYLMKFCMHQLLEKKKKTVFILSMAVVVQERRFLCKTIIFKLPSEKRICLAGASS